MKEQNQFFVNHSIITLVSFLLEPPKLGKINTYKNIIKLNDEIYSPIIGWKTQIRKLKLTENLFQISDDVDPHNNVCRSSFLLQTNKKSYRS